ncbi:MAG: tetratricopeptide repeat protein [Polyangia bacterium]
MPVLSEALEQGGGAARLADALLLRLGEKPVLPPSSELLWSSGAVEQRLQALESVVSLPVSQAAALLARAARDRDAAVRMQVAELAARLGDVQVATSLLRLLAQDSDAAVRARSGTLLAQVTAAPSPPPVNPTVDAPPPATPPPATPPPLAPLPTTAPAETSSAPEKPGLTLAEQLAQNGVQLLERRDFAHAQPLLERARKLCAKDKRSATCAELAINLSFHLGRAYEAQGQLAEAMTEFERVIKAPSAGRDKARAAQQQVAQEAVLRLVPKLGVVVIKRRAGSACQQTSRWMPPGSHRIEVDGEQQEVSVQATQTVQVGSCP